MSFSELALQFCAQQDSEQIDGFHTSANSVRIMADTSTTFLQEALEQLIASKEEQLQLHSREEIIFATSLVFNCAQEVSLDPSEKQEIEKLKKCVYLSKLIFEQNKAQIPLSFYSAYSIIMLRFLEAIELSKIDEMQLVNQSLRQINFLLASNDVESQKLMTNLVRDILARFYQTINKTTINIAIQFLNLQEDWLKLIELFSGKYFTRMGSHEHEIVEKAYLALDQHIQHIIIRKQTNKVDNISGKINNIAQSSYSLEELDEEDENESELEDNSKYSNYNDSQEETEINDGEIDVFTNYLLVCLSTTHHTALQVTIPEYAIPYLFKTQINQFHRIINSLLQTGVALHKYLAVILSQAALTEKFVNELTCIQIIEIVTGICNALSNPDEQYFQITIKFVCNVISLKTNILCYPQHIENIIHYGKQKCFNKSSTSSKKTKTIAENDINNIDITIMPAGLNLEFISVQQFKTLYCYTCVVLYLIPILIYISILRLSTINGIVSSSIQIRKTITEFYGSLHRNKIVVQFVMTLLNQGGFLPINKQITQEKTNNTQMLVVQQFITSDQNKEMQDLYTRIIKSTAFTFPAIKNVLLEITTQIYKVLQNRFDNFLQTELLFRISDESQNVKRAAAQQILDDIQDNQYDNIHLLFTDIFQMINQETFLQQTFDQFILMPIYDKQTSITQKLLNFIEKSPFKLFESTFATFLKDRTVDANVYLNLLQIKTVGGVKLIYYLLAYSSTSNLVNKQFQQISQEMIANVINPHLSLPIKLYSLYVLVLNKALLQQVNNDQLIEQEFQNIFNAYQQIQHKQLESVSQGEVQIMTELRNVMQLRGVDKHNQQQLQNIANKCINQLKENYSLQTLDPAQFVVYNQHVLLNIAYMVKENIFSQEAMEKLTAQIQKIVAIHPTTAYPLTAFIFASNDIEFRLNVFEIMINEYSSTKETIIANNLLFGIMSCIYAYPDELGQFITLVLDNDLLQTSFLMQRHLMYILCDLNRLLLVKLTKEAFIQMYLTLISPNTDLQALAGRLLLSQTQGNTYYNLFVQNFILGMETLIELGVEEVIRASLYGKILYKLPQTQKYQLINVLLEKCTNVVISQEYLVKQQWFYNDVLGIIQSGTIQVAIQEEWANAEKIVKKLNVQYSISAVLPKLFQILNISNQQQLQQLQQKAIQAIRAVSQQMKLTYQDLTIQFGDEYANELIQVKW